MANRETEIANAYETSLTAEMGPNDTTATVSSTSGGPASPAYLVVEPENSSRREVVFFDGSFSGTSFSTTTTNNRYLSGSASTSGITHPIQSIVRSAPLSQHVRDLNDRVDAEAVSPSHGHGVGTQRDISSTYLTRDDGTLQSYSEEFVQATVGSSTYTCNLDTANTFNLDITTDCDIYFTNWPGSGEVGKATVRLTSNGYTVNFPNVRWPGGNKPSITNNTDYYVFVSFDSGGTIDAAQGPANFQ